MRSGWFFLVGLVGIFSKLEIEFSSVRGVLFFSVACEVVRDFSPSDDLPFLFRMLALGVSSGEWDWILLGWVLRAFRTTRRRANAQERRKQWHFECAKYADTLFSGWEVWSRHTLAPGSSAWAILSNNRKRWVWGLLHSKPAFAPVDANSGVGVQRGGQCSVHLSHSVWGCRDVDIVKERKQTFSCVQTGLHRMQLQHVGRGRTEEASWDPPVPRLPLAQSQWSCPSSSSQRYCEWCAIKHADERQHLRASVHCQESFSIAFLDIKSKSSDAIYQHIVVSGFNSEMACNAWAMHSVPALVERAYWKGAVAALTASASFACAIVRPTNLRRMSATMMPRTPPGRFLQRGHTPQSDHLVDVSRCLRSRQLLSHCKQEASVALIVQQGPQVVDCHSRRSCSNAFPRRSEVGPRTFHHPSWIELLERGLAHIREWDLGLEVDAVLRLVKHPECGGCWLRDWRPPKLGDPLTTSPTESMCGPVGRVVRARVAGCLVFLSSYAVELASTLCLLACNSEIQLPSANTSNRRANFRFSMLPPLGGRCRSNLGSNRNNRHPRSRLANVGVCCFLHRQSHGTAIWSSQKMRQSFHRRSPFV